MVSAMYGGARKPVKKSARRAERSDYNPLRELSKMVADVMWERAKVVAEAMAPEMPADAEPLDEVEQYEILERVALELSPVYWDNPDAIKDLYEFRKKFTGQDDQMLKMAYEQVSKLEKKLPDPTITPANPEYEKMMRRAGLMR